MPRAWAIMDDVPMTKRDEFWIFLGLFGFFLLNYPLLHIFNRDLLIAGIPILTLYLFGVWILAIVALYVFVRQLAVRDEQNQKETNV